MIPLSFFVFMRKWWKAGAGVILGALLCLPLAYCKGGSDMRDRVQAQYEKAAAEQARRNAAAIEAAAEQRARDILANSAKAQERSNAIRSGPDAPTSGPECRLNRERLRQAGYPDAKLPKCG